MWAMGGALASSTGPVLGGVLTLVSWRLIFLINLPVGVAGLLLVARIAPSPRRRVPFDWVGQATAVVAMAGLTFGVIAGGAAGFTAPEVVVALTIAATALVGFIATESRAADPMVPLRLFRSSEVRVSMAVGFAFVVGYYGLPFVMSLYLQQLRGLSSFRAGLVFVPMMVSGAVLTPVSARIVEHFGSRRVISTGLVLLAAGLAELTAVTVMTPIAMVALMMVLVGVAGPLIIPPMIAVLLNSVSDREAGTASGVFNTSRQIGGALAVAVFGALIGAGDLLSGLHVSVLIAAAVTIAAAAAATRLHRTTDAVVAMETAGV
jgi:MFS family permease